MKNRFSMKVTRFVTDMPTAYQPQRTKKTRRLSCCTIGGLLYGCGKKHKNA
jgi:hypothetical protein